MLDSINQEWFGHMKQIFNTWEQAHRVKVGVGRDGAVNHVENKIKFCVWPKVIRTCLAKLTISDNSKRMF